MRTSEARFGSSFIWAVEQVQASCSCSCHRNCRVPLVLEDAQAADALVLDGDLGLPTLAVRVDVLVAALAAPEDDGSRPSKSSLVASPSSSTGTSPSSSMASPACRAVCFPTYYSMRKEH